MPAFSLRHFLTQLNRLVAFDVSVLWGFAGGGVRLAKHVKSSIKIDSQHMVFSAELVWAHNTNS